MAGNILVFLCRGSGTLCHFNFPADCLTGSLRERKTGSFRPRPLVGRSDSRTRRAKASRKRGISFQLMGFQLMDQSHR